MIDRRSNENGSHRCGFILAGGDARRMGGADKATVLLEGIRLVDRVVSRLAAQVDRVALCGRDDYETGLPVVCDRAEGPKGPAAGLYAAECWMRANARDCDGFFTVPVDGPFLPDDLVARLADAGGSAIAADRENDHPTFAYWTLDALEAFWVSLGDENAPSLRQIAAACGAMRIVWDDPCTFYNINSPEDVKLAAATLRAQATLR